MTIFSQGSKKTGVVQLRFPFFNQPILCWKKAVTQYQWDSVAWLKKKLMQLELICKLDPYH